MDTSDVVAIILVVVILLIMAVATSANLASHLENRGVCRMYEYKHTERTRMGPICFRYIDGQLEWAFLDDLIGGLEHDSKIVP